MLTKPILGFGQDEKVSSLENSRRVESPRKSRTVGRDDLRSNVSDSNIKRYRRRRYLFKPKSLRYNGKYFVIFKLTEKSKAKFREIKINV